MRLEVDSVMIRFKENVVLSDVSASFETNKIYGILGRNGSGKSTFFKIVFGAIEPEYATIKIDGVYRKNWYPTNLIKFMPQHFIIPESLIIEDACYLFGSDKEECLLLFGQFKINSKQKIGQLSGGQRRLVELFIFLTSQAPFLILDEPFTHLMPIQIEELKPILKKYKEKKSMIVSDHQYRHILDVSDKISLIRYGKLHHLSETNIIGQLQDLMYIL